MRNPLSLPENARRIEKEGRSAKLSRRSGAVSCPVAGAPMTQLPRTPTRSAGAPRTRGPDGEATVRDRAKDTASAEAIAAFVLADAAVHGAKRADPKAKARTNKQRRRTLARLQELHTADEVKVIADTAALRPLDLTALGKLGPIARSRVVDAMRDAIADILHAGVQSPRARRRIFDGYLLIGYGSARQDEPSDRDATYAIDRGHAHIDRGHAIEAEERAAREKARRLVAYAPMVTVSPELEDDEADDNGDDEAEDVEVGDESTAATKARPGPASREDEGATGDAAAQPPPPTVVEPLGTTGLMNASRPAADDWAAAHLANKPPARRLPGMASPASLPPPTHAKTAAFLPPLLVAAGVAEHFDDLDLHRMHDMARAHAVRERACWLARERDGRRVLDPTVIERIDRMPNGWRTT